MGNSDGSYRFGIGRTVIAITASIIPLLRRGGKKSKDF